MDVEIVSQEENPMLHRSDVTFELTHTDATPARLQIRDSLAAKLNKEADEVVIRKIDTKFGMRKSVGYAKVYESGDHAASIEQDHMLDRNKIDEDDAAEEADEPEAEPDEAEPEPEEEAEEEEEPEAEVEEEPEAEVEAAEEAEPEEEEAEAVEEAAEEETDEEAE